MPKNRWVDLSPFTPNRILWPRHDRTFRLVWGQLFCAKPFNPGILFTITVFVLVFYYFQIMIVICHAYNMWYSSKYVCMHACITHTFIYTRIYMCVCIYSVGSDIPSAGWMNDEKKGGEPRRYANESISGFKCYKYVTPQLKAIFLHTLSLVTLD